MPKFKHIRITLAEDPNTFSTAEMDNWTGTLVHISRSQIENKLPRKNTELKRHGVCFLFGVCEGQPAVYIGEGESIVILVKKLLKRSFWQEAVIFVSKDNYVNKASIKYLKHELFWDLKKSGRYWIVNAKDPDKSELSMPEQVGLKVAQRNIRLLLARLTDYRL